MFQPRVTNPDQYDALTAWGTSGNLEGQFNQPSGVAVSGAYVYVVDRENNRVQKFEPSEDDSGLYDVVISWGMQGGENGQFFLPRDVVVDAFGSVYIADTSN